MVYIFVLLGIVLLVLVAFFAASTGVSILGIFYNVVRQKSDRKFTPKYNWIKLSIFCLLATLALAILAYALGIFGGNTIAMY